MAACVTISRFVLVLLNLLLFVMGALLIVAGILALYVPDQIISNGILERSADLMVVFNASYITIAAWVCVGLGVVIVIVAMCGCMGSACSSKVLLGIYIFVVIQIVLVQVGVAVVIYLSPEWFTAQAQNTLDTYVAHYPMRDPFDEPVPAEAVAWNVFQYAVGCCGLNGPADYENLTEAVGRKYYRSCCMVADRSEAALAAANKTTDKASYNYTDETQCLEYFEKVVQEGSETTEDNEKAQYVNVNGCVAELTENLQTYAIAAIAVVAIQFFIIIIACIVCCSAGDDDEKPI